MLFYKKWIYLDILLLTVWWYMWMMRNNLEDLTSTEILDKKTVGRTSVLFTKKALLHVLDQHSEEAGTEKAKLFQKICFHWTKEVEEKWKEIVAKLPDELERYRKNGVKLTEDPRKSLISHIYLPWSKEWIVQLKFLQPNIFEIVSFYKKKK